MYLYENEIMERIKEVLEVAFLAKDYVFGKNDLEHVKDGVTKIPIPWWLNWRLLF